MSKKVKPAPQYQSMWGPVVPKDTTVIMRADQVWAEEPGRSVRFTEINNGGAIQIEIMDAQSQILTATIGRWRWDRIVRALALEVKP
jgi:hypothetical protein